ncbi:TIGR00341 family protein [Haloarchaeobius sp. HME9146]|uniref:TIGR00341 family protein n=1 Tax=Haloarchaeobius sp. HME9146 TaxID=2978732 RepID=UPI0021BF40B1|nr:TIGR00341 family protein [Haloarchaeobius sp. HME9146]MCT9096941.1 TIGR00341 family protein [Haloarchaeobius sp. HME9146]
MRLVRVLARDERVDDLVEVLQDEDVDYVITSEAREDDDAVLIEFPIPIQAVDYVLDRLRDAGLDDERYTVISTAETAKTSHYDELEDRFVAGVEEDDTVASEEIRGKALGMHRNALTYYSMTGLSAIVAAVGLLLDSPAIVVGAMVIAPQVGRALITSVGMALGDRQMLKLGVRTQLAGYAAAIVGATVLGVTIRYGQLLPVSLHVSGIGQVAKRISPGLLSFVVAVCSGAAGAFGLATALPVSLVGVMIAAALIPAAAAVGIGLAWGAPSVAIGAFVLLVANAVAVNLSGFAVLWYLGYRPDGWDGLSGRRSAREYWPTFVTLVALLLVVTAAGTVLTGKAAFDTQTNDAVSETLDRSEYEALELVAVQTEMTGFDHGPTDGARGVTVVVNRPADEQFPDLASTIEAAVERQTGTDVTVSVEFQEVQSSGRDGRD